MSAYFYFFIDYCNVKKLLKKHFDMQKMYLYSPFCWNWQFGLILLHWRLETMWVIVLREVLIFLKALQLKSSVLWYLGEQWLSVVKLKVNEVPLLLDCGCYLRLLLLLKHAYKHTHTSNLLSSYNGAMFKNSLHHSMTSFMCCGCVSLLLILNLLAAANFRSACN